jgi:Holliday junction DNA helicase RuvB
LSNETSAVAAPEDRDAEATVRPKRLAEFVGQQRVREQLDVLLRSALRRGSPPDHILLSG